MHSSFSKHTDRLNRQPAKTQQKRISNGGNGNLSWVRLLNGWHGKLLPWRHPYLLNFSWALALYMNYLSHSTPESGWTSHPNTVHAKLSSFVCSSSLQGFRFCQTPVTAGTVLKCRVVVMSDKQRERNQGATEVGQPSYHTGGATLYGVLSCANLLRLVAGAQTWKPKALQELDGPLQAVFADARVKSGDFDVCHHLKLVKTLQWGKTLKQK